MPDLWVKMIKYPSELVREDFSFLLTRGNCFPRVCQSYDCNQKCRTVYLNQAASVRDSFHSKRITTTGRLVWLISCCSRAEAVVKIEISCCRVRLPRDSAGSWSVSEGELILNVQFCFLTFGFGSFFLIFPFYFDRSWTQTRRIFSVPVCTQQQSHRAHRVLYFLK